MNMATEIFNGFLRLDDFPLDESSIFSTYASAETYAKENATAYAGQIIAVVTEVKVDLYLITYPFTENYQGNFELTEVGSAGGIESVNGITPVDNVVTIYGTDIKISVEDATTIATSLSRLEGITANETTITSTKTISAPKISITGNINLNTTDAVNSQHLETRLDSKRKGITYTIKYALTNTGKPYDVNDIDLPVGAVITKVKLYITQAYQSPINVKIGNQIVMSSTDIFENTIGLYILEPNLIVEQISSFTVETDVISATGAGTIYIEYITREYN
jgi:hypothetical protein